LVGAYDVIEERYLPVGIVIRKGYSPALGGKI